MQHDENDSGRTGCLIYVTIMLVLVGAGVWMVLCEMPLVGGFLLIGGLGMYFFGTSFAGSGRHEQQRQARDLKEYGEIYFKIGHDHDDDDDDKKQPPEKDGGESEHDCRR